MISNNNLLSNHPHLHSRILNHLFLFSDHQICADPMDSTLLHCPLLLRCCSKTAFSNGRKMQSTKLGFLSRNHSLTSVHLLKLFLDIKIDYFTVNLRTGQTKTECLKASILLRNCSSSSSQILIHTKRDIYLNTIGSANSSDMTPLK